MNSRKILISLIVVIALMRLMSIFFVQGFTDDEMVYMGLGRSLQEGLGYGYVGSPLIEVTRSPLLPVFLGTVYFFGATETISLLLSSILGILAILPVYLIGKEMFNEKIGLYAALFLAANPLHWFYSTKVLTESLLVLLGSIFLYTFLISLENKKYLLPTIAILPFIFLTKYTGILFSIFFIFYVVIKKRELFKERDFWVGVAIAFLIISPWFYMNYNIYGNPLGQTFGLASGAASGTTYDVDKSYLYGLLDLNAGPLFYLFALPVQVSLLLPLTVIGFYWLYKKRYGNFWILFVFCLLFLIGLTGLELRKYRYLMPLIPVLTIYSAIGFDYIKEMKIQKYVAPIILSILLAGNIFIVYYEFGNHPKMEKYVGLEEASLYLKNNCTGKEIYSNASPYVWWYLHESAKSLSDISTDQKNVCIMLNGYDFYNETVENYISVNYENVFINEKVKVFISPS